VQILLAKLEHEHEYVKNEMDLRLALLMAAKGWGRGRLPTLESLLAEREKIIHANPADGVILQDGRTP
jgi:hypothetical protein